MTETVSLKEAAEQLDVHYMTAYRYVRNGRLAAHKAGAEWRVRAADLEQLVRGDLAEPAPRARRASHRTGLESRLLAGDEPGAWGIVEAAMASGAEPSEVLIDLVAPAMVSIGERWAAGELTIADEHQASAVAQRIVARVGPRFARRGRKRGHIVVGAAPLDRHSLPSAIVADLLRGSGFAVTDLGADTPTESFVESALAAERLMAVAISVTSAEGLSTVATTVASIRSTVGPDVAIIVGGGAITNEDHAVALGSDGFAPDGRTLINLIDGWIATR